MNIHEKYKRALMRRGGFTIIPNVLLTGDHWSLDGRPMEFRHRMLLVALLSLDFHGGWFKAGRRALKKSGLGNDAIARATEELVAAGLVKVSAKPNCLTEYNLEGFYERFLEDGQPPETPSTPEVPAPRAYTRPADLAAALAASDDK